jgi:hypothetical protein
MWPYLVVGHEPGSTPKQRGRTAIWCTCLHNKINDLRLGFMGRIRVQMNVDISYRDFFTDSSIQGIARIVEARATRPEPKRVVLI